MDNEKLIKQTNVLAESVHETAQKQTHNAPMQETERQITLTKAQILAPDAIRIEPFRRIRTKAKIRMKLEKRRKYENEYVTGIFENKVCPGDGIHFWMNNLPGDDYCEWKIPANKPVSIPRHVANHLHNNLKYHIFRYSESHNQYIDEFKEKFEVAETKERGSFLPTQAFG